MKNMRSDDPIELMIANALSEAGWAFTHESENKDQRLDFYLPGVDVYIECKQFHTYRISDQIKPFPNVIVIQGRKAAEIFCQMVSVSQ
jgi:hypothetical protein